MPENFDLAALTWDEEPRRIERVKAVANELMKRIPDLQARSGLEYGCGTGLLSFELQPYLKQIVLVDNSDGMLQVVARKIKEGQIEKMMPLKADLTAGPLPDLRSDLVYSLMVLHHIDDTERILKAFFELLNPGGYVGIADLDEEDGSFHGPDFTGHHGFNREALADRLGKIGFTDISSTICHETVRKTGDGTEKRYPTFLMVGRK